jgi:outer membrane receptor protein involved in Fe transport
MEGVEVTAEKPVMEYKMDKKVINVNRDIISQGGSAVTVLENSPSVQVDVEGNVTLRGSSNFTVFINNRPSVLQGSDALEQIPATSIETIEIITNPSAKYDPDGIGGIINVVLKKEADSGLNGIFDISAGTGDKYSTNLLLNYQKSDFTVFGGVDFRKDRRSFEGNSEKIYKYLDPVKHIESDMNGGRTHDGYTLKGGFGYNITKLTTVNLEGNFGSSNFKRTHNHDRFQWLENSALDSFFLNYNTMDRERDFYSLNLDLMHRFDTKGHQLSFAAYFSDNLGGGENMQEDYTSDVTWKKIARSSYNVWTTEDESENEYRLKADYTLPLGNDTKFEAGYQARIDREREVYNLKMMDSLFIWQEKDEYDNAMDFSRDIHSLYSTYSDKISDFSFSAGLRAEYTNRVIGVEKENKDYIIDRLDWFPTLHMSQDLGTSQQIMLSYSRRIQRPRGWDLEPSVMYMDANSFRVGNPALEPEYINSVELGYQKYFGMSYYRLTTNKITRMRELVDDMIYYRVINLNQDYTLGLELSANYEPAKFLRFNASSSIYKYQMDGNVSDEEISKSTTVWDANFMATYTMPTETRLQVNGFYSGPTISAQGTIAGSFSLNMAIRQDFFDKHASLTLQVRDILGTMKREFNSNSIDLYTYDLRDFESPVFNLSFSYKLNNFKQKQKDRDSENGGGMEGDF